MVKNSNASANTEALLFCKQKKVHVNYRHPELSLASTTSFSHSVWPFSIMPTRYRPGVQQRTASIVTTVWPFEKDCVAAYTTAPEALRTVIAAVPSASQ